jgi:gas vesicle protein
MSEELNDKDPFANDEVVDVEDPITDAMVKKATYHIHKLADQKGQDYKEIQKKCKVLFNYSNLAKVSMDQGHQIINKLIELTGGEEEKPQLSRKPDEKLKGTIKDNVTHEKTVQEPKHEEKEVDDLVTGTMRKAIRAAVDITIKEVVDKAVPVQGLGGFVLEIGKVIFEAKMSEEASK